MIRTALLAFALVIVAPAAAEFRVISQDEAKRMMADGGAVILDVRTEAEHREIRIPGSVLIPVNEIPAKAAAILPDKNAVILVYCRRGNRSKTAAGHLAAMGYKNVFEFGGINTWRYETITGGNP